MGRVGEVVRRAFQNAAAMRALRGARAGPGDNERVLRHLAKVTINPAITHGLAATRRLARPGKLADVVLWQPQFFGRAARAGAQGGLRRCYGASGEGNAIDDAGRAGQPASAGRRPAARRPRGSHSHSSRARRWTRSCRRPRPRARVEGCRDLTAASMVRNSRTGEVRVDPRTPPVTLDGEPIEAPPLEEVALSGRYLLG